MSGGSAEYTFTEDRLRNGPFDLPRPELGSTSQLHRALFRLLNYLVVEWCSGDVSTFLRVAFRGASPYDNNMDLGIIVSNSDHYIKKAKLDEVFSECHALLPFLGHRVNSPSLMVSGSLSSHVNHFHKLWVTPRGVLTHEQPVLRRTTNNAIMCILMDFRGDIRVNFIRDVLFYYLVRLNLGCSENLLIDFKFASGQHLENLHYSIHQRSSVPSGLVNIKSCGKCGSCRVQSTKPRPVTVKGHEMSVRLAVRRCYGSSGRCADRTMSNSLTVLGPASLPVNYSADPEFERMFERLKKDWKDPNPGHLILIFECPISRGNVHTIMDALRESCFQVFSRVAPALKSSLKQILNRTSSSTAAYPDLTTAAHNLAFDIADVVLESENEDFRRSVLKLLPATFHSNLLAGTIRDVARRNGVPVGSEGEGEPPSKRLKRYQEEEGESSSSSAEASFRTCSALPSSSTGASLAETQPAGKAFPPKLTSSLSSSFSDGPVNDCTGSHIDSPPSISEDCIRVAGFSLTPTGEPARRDELDDFESLA